MLDLLGVLFSTIGVLLVAVRAAKLDEVYPWFDPIPDSESGAAPGHDARRTMDALGGQRHPR